MDVLSRLFPPVEPRILMVASGLNDVQNMEQWLHPLGIAVEGLRAAQLASYSFEKRRHKAILLEPTRACLAEALQCLHDIRRVNHWASVLLGSTSPMTPAMRLNYLQAGADHVLRVPGKDNEREPFYQDLFRNPDYWNLSPPVLDPARLCLSDDNRRLDLSYPQVQVLMAMLRAPHHQLDFDELADCLGFNMRSYDMRVLEKFVSRLRNSIRKTFGTNAIQNMRGVGYRLTRGTVAPLPVLLR